MQFVILSVGVLLFVFYQFHAPPIFFNQPELARAPRRARAAASCATSRPAGTTPSPRRAATATALVDARHAGDPARIAATESALRDEAARTDGLRRRAIEIIGQSRARAETKDAGLRLPPLRPRRVPAGPGRPAHRGDPVRRDVGDRQRAQRARLDERRRLLQAQPAPGRRRRALPPRRQAVHRRLGRRRRRLRHLRLAARQPDPGGEHPRLDLLRADARRVPGRLLHAARRAGPPPSSPRCWRRRRCCRCCWVRRLGFLWYNVVGCAVVVAVALVGGWLSPRPVR